MDAFQAAQMISLVVATILVGSLQYAFVPVFIEAQSKHGDKAAWTIAGTTGAILIPGIALLSLGGCVAAKPVIVLLFPRFSPEQSQMTIELFRILVWLTWTISVTAFLQTVLQAARVFRPAAIGPLIGIGVTFGASWLSYSRWGIHGVAWSTLLGQLVSLLWQLPLWMQRSHFRWGVDAGTRKMWWMLVPLLLGAAVYKVDPLVDRFLASGLPVGSISHLGYASRLIAALLTLTSNGLAMVVFPALSLHASAGQTEHLKQELSRALQFLVCLIIPLCVLIGCHSEVLIRDLMERGRFVPTDTVIVSHLTLLSLGVLIGGSASELLSKTLFAMGDTRSPTICRLIVFLVSVGFKFWWAMLYGLPGLVWATTFQYLMVMLLDMLLVHRKVGRMCVTDLLESLWKAGLSAGLAATLTTQFIPQTWPLVSVWNVLAGAGVYVCGMIWLREPIVTRLLGRRPGS